MKLSSILAGAAALLSHAVLAAEGEGVGYVIKTVINARIEVRVDEYGYTVHNYQRLEDREPLPTGDNQLVKRACSKNNCVRALIARPAQASSFCATYTTASSAGVGPFTQCDNSKTLSAACTCQVPVRLVLSPPHPCRGLQGDGHSGVSTRVGV